MLDEKKLLSDLGIEKSNRAFVLEYNVLREFPVSILQNSPGRFFITSDVFISLEKIVKETDSLIQTHDRLKREFEFKSGQFARASEAQKILFSDGWDWWTYSMLEEKAYGLLRGLVYHTSNKRSYEISFSEKAWEEFLPYVTVGEKNSLYGFFNTGIIGIEITLDYVERTAIIAKRGQPDRHEVLNYGKFSEFSEEMSLPDPKKVESDLLMLGESLKTEITEEQRNEVASYAYFNKHRKYVMKNSQSNGFIRDIISDIPLFGQNEISTLTCAYFWDFAANGAKIKDNYRVWIVTMNRIMDGAIRIINYKKGLQTSDTHTVRSYLASG